MHSLENCDGRDRLNGRARGCCALCSVVADVVRRREVGRKHGATVAEVMRRRRSALDGAIVAGLGSVEGRQCQTLYTAGCIYRFPRAVVLRSQGVMGRRDD